MKTLILNGSPRKNGDTVSLVHIFLEGLEGEYKIVNAYEDGINPCMDCRFCQENDGCSIQDGMQEVYEYIQECDNILIASPIYFSELTGKLLDLGSRLQTYFCASFFRNKSTILKGKRGAVIIVGGGDGNVTKPYETACTLLHHMNAYDIFPVVYSHNTNRIPAAEDKEAVEGAKKISFFFNQGNGIFGSKRVTELEVIKR